MIMPAHACCCLRRLCYKMMLMLCCRLMPPPFADDYAAAAATPFADILRCHFADMLAADEATRHVTPRAMLISLRRRLRHDVIDMLLRAPDTRCRRWSPDGMMRYGCLLPCFR